MFISFLMMNSQGFRTKVGATPWLPLPIVMAVSLFMAMILISIFSKLDFSHYGFKLRGNLMILEALLCGLLIGGVTLAVVSFIPSKELTFGSPTFLERLCIFWLLPSITEEVIFRGLIQTYLSSSIPASFAVSRLRLSVAGLISAMLFGLVHLGLLTQGAGRMQTIATVVAALILGILAGYFRDKTGSLVAPVIIHTLFNVLGYIVASII